MFLGAEYINEIDMFYQENFNLVSCFVLLLQLLSVKAFSESIPSRNEAMIDDVYCKNCSTRFSWHFL